MIDWAAFGIVALASIVSASVVVSLFAFGLRLLNVGSGVDAEETPDMLETTSTGTISLVGSDRQNRPRWATISAIACFSLCGLAVLYGIYLIVPFLHS